MALYLNVIATYLLGKVVGRRGEEGEIWSSTGSN